MARELGEWARSLDLNRQSKALYEELHNLLGVGGLVLGMGVMALQAGDYQRAERLLGAAENRPRLAQRRHQIRNRSQSHLKGVRP